MIVILAAIVAAIVAQDVWAQVSPGFKLALAIFTATRAKSTRYVKRLGIKRRARTIRARFNGSHPVNAYTIRAC